MMLEIKEIDGVPVKGSPDRTRTDIKIIILIIIFSTSGAWNARAYIDAGRLDYVIEVSLPKTHLMEEPGSRSIYKYPRDIDLNLFEFTAYKRDHNGKVSTYTY